MKILVTGVNGYLGQGIVKAILDNGHEVVAADFLVDRVDDRAKKIAGNMFEIENPYEFYGKPEVLLHLAWRDGFVHYSNAHIDDLPKHFSFIKKMSEGGIKQIAVMGSMHEIGFFEGSINENTPCHPTTPYGIGKNALRDLTQMVCKQKNIVFQWMRGYYVVGNSKYGSSIFSKITAAVEEGKTEFPFTLGQNQYDFIDYSDFCAQVAAVAGQQKEQGIINICSGRPEKLADRVERFIYENGYKIKLQYGAFPDRPYDSKAIWGDSTKIEKIMNKGTI
ncbi:TPA: NAD(P)-dependent oxidoreductase [Enterococcus faecium]|uniref:NAD-dependent epimerase/dehydratase family protein n=1 Tax=Enterococcus TaxID=1350 RepID=UPI000A93BD17|nr:MULTISPECIES: NAD(P)-dependent oxidoreductase [Enterococcus]MBX8951367.1 NAD(P)-dependent oxidoreductase [Escherichia coli]EME3531682.1 NAD(P)-dependent oxidoreductase [Enterococcus faecium]EME7082484.1 NAD(P)-dependent oxidoreductase [Enterococcus faecium]MBE8864846.1 NAD(P)-dependent oxidoreductase [Enterococcus faecium]MBJ0617708.1 NAD(P)-dependent oxidoreductase [Enterococcus faecium]